MPKQKDMNKYLKNFKPYRLVKHKAWEIDDKSTVLKLDWNEATIRPSPRVIESVIDFISSGKINWYPDLDNEVLITELSKYCDVPRSNIQYVAGSDSLHELIIRAFTNASDKICVVSPTYDNFRATAESAGVIIKNFYLDEDYSFNIRDFKEFLSLDNTISLVYLCNPNNPTGTCVSHEDIVDLVNYYPDVKFIIDEAYFEFHKITVSDLSMSKENVIICRTFSKAFALASFRIGYVISSEANIRLINMVRNPKNINAISQVAAVAALRDINYMWSYVKEVVKARTKMYEDLTKIFGGDAKIFVGGGNFIFIRFKNPEYNKLLLFLEEEKIFVRDFGQSESTKNSIRITVGSIKEMDKVVNKIALHIQENGR